MLNILQEATAMAETFRASRGSSSLGRGATLEDVGASTKRISVMFVMSAGALLMAFTYAPVARLDAPDAFAIKDAQIVTGAGKTIAKGTVVFRKGLITDVGENVKIPGDARVIDGAGMTVYPGLIDGYTNLGLAAPARLRLPEGAAVAGRRRLLLRRPAPSLHQRRASAILRLPQQIKSSRALRLKIRDPLASPQR
jgi:hypothetical protein